MSCSAADQLFLREVQCVGRGQRGQQFALVTQVVQDHHLFAVRLRELPTRLGIPNRQRQSPLRRAPGTPADAHAPADQRPEHREEAPRVALDRAGVRAVHGHVAEAVEQRLPRNANVVERQAAVVDAVEPGLGTAVLDGDAGRRRSALVADRHHERVNAPRLAARDELREHHRRVPVARGVADVLLHGAAIRGVHDELGAVRVVRRGGPQMLDVRTMTVLGHREAAEQLQVLDPAQVPLMVPPGAQQLHGTAEQPPLHPGLDHERQVAEAEHLERHDRTAGVAPAAVGLVEAQPRPVGRGDRLQLLEDPGPVRFDPEVDRILVRLDRHLRPDIGAQRGPTAVQDGRQGLRIDLGGDGRHGDSCQWAAGGSRGS